ncbi:MAG: ribosome assembly cofactor RimP [Candidatus Limimorpha sp.]
MMGKEQIEAFAAEAVEGTDRFLVEVKIKAGNVIEVLLDADTAVAIDDCIAVSRFIESRLDRDMEDFELNVLSYGLSSPLVMERQLTKYVGKEVEVKTKDWVKVAGKLIAFDEQTVEIEPLPKKNAKKKKKEAAETGNLKLDRSQIELRPYITF